MNKLDEIINELGTKYYPVGSVVITSTNVGSTYMHDLYGGTWALKRKRFANKVVTDAFTFNTTNTQSGASVVTLYKDSILCRLVYAPKVAFGDSTLQIATLDCTKIGIRQNSDIFQNFWMAHGDAIGALNFIGVKDTVESYDICTKTTATTVAASTNTFQVTFPLSFAGYPDTMLDSFCDEFWWVRTA